MLEMFLKSDIKYQLGRQNDYFYNFIWNRHEQGWSQFSVNNIVHNATHNVQRPTNLFLGFLSDVAATATEAGCWQSPVHMVASLSLKTGDNFALTTFVVNTCSSLSWKTPQITKKCSSLWYIFFHYPPPLSKISSSNLPVMAFAWELISAISTGVKLCEKMSSCEQQIPLFGMNRPAL